MGNSLRNGIRLYELGRYENAVEELLQDDDDPGENPIVAYYLGLSYTKLEDFASALSYLEQVVTSSANLLHIYQCRMILGYIYTLTGRYKLARFEFEELLEGGYESPQAWSALGYIAFMEGKKEQSLDCYRKALKLDPSNTNALNSLGFTMADIGLDLERAEELCGKALKKRPQNPAYLDSMGWISFRQGKLETAKEYLRRALDKAGKNSDIAEHLRIVLSEEKKG